MSNIITTEPKFIFLIPSYNRYDKLVNLLNQIKIYDNVSVIVVNDASTDGRYKLLDNIYNNLTIIHNTKNNGKALYNNTIISLINSTENINYDYVIMLSDDFVLCNNFIPLLLECLSEYNIVNIFSIYNANWSYPGWIDGAFACSKNALPIIKANIKPINHNNENASTGVWRMVSQYFIKNKQSEYKLIVLNYSLTQHDGNDDSKLHPKHRLVTPITAKNFYNDFLGNEIKIIGDSTMPLILKKKDTPNGNVKKKDIPNGDGVKKKYIIPNGEPIIEVKIESPTIPVTSSPIEHDRSGLDNIREGLNKQKQSRITKINDDIFIAKARKRNLRLGGR
jgi:hypothetical protein